MESEGLCDVCGAPNATYTCMLCGKRVCPRCLTVGGACRLCVEGRVAPDFREPGPKGPILK
ncbi:MAG: orotate phosphoribosyltransferase [Candidatus Altiarchaeota archaeon]